MEELTLAGRSIMSDQLCHWVPLALYKRTEWNRWWLPALQALSCLQHILYMVLNVSGLNSSSAHVLCHHLLYFICTPRRGWGVVGTLEPAAGSGKQSSTGVSIATYVTRATHMHTRTEACTLSQPCRGISCISVRIHTPTLSVPHWCLPAATSNTLLVH